MVSVNVSIDDWVMREILNPSAAGNRSARIQELVIKGFMYERDKEKINPLFQISPGNLAEALA